MCDKSAIGQLKKYGKKAVIAVVGTVVLLIGILMLVTPGPAFILIPAGLAILAVEFIWARHLLKRMKDFIRSKIGKTKSRKSE